MQKTIIVLIYFLLSFFTSCESEADKMGDKYFSSFKTKISLDSLAGDAYSDAEMVVVMSSDSAKVYEAREWMKNFDRAMKYFATVRLEKNYQESIFFHSVIEIKKTLETETSCKRIVKRYLINPLKKDSVSIMRATKYLTDSVFNSVPITGACQTPSKCMVILFQTNYDYRIGRWLSLGRRITAQPTEVEYSFETIK